MSKKGITIRYEDEDYQLLEKKAKRYGYETLSAYIRDMSLNGIIVIEDFKTKKEICISFDEIRRMMIKEESVLRNEIENIAENREDKIRYEGLINKLIHRRKIIERTINEKLFRSFIKEKENMIKNEEW